MLEAVREGGLLPRRNAGGGDAVGRERLGLPASTSRCGCSEPSAVTALHVNYGLRDDSDADEAHCAALCERLGVRARGRATAPSGGPRQPAGLGARHALRGRGAAWPSAPARRSPPATPPTTRSRRSSTGSPPRPAGVPCWVCGRATASWCGRCSASPASRPPPIARSGGWPGATTRATPSPRYARNRVRHGLARGARRGSPGRGAERAAHGGAAARRGARCWTRWSSPSSTAPGGSPRNTIELERLAELPPALRRLVVQQLADRAAGRPVAGAARHAEEVAALRRTGTAMLDLGGGVRAIAERGTLRAER